MKSLRRLGLLSSRSIFSNGVPTTTIGGVRYASTEAAAGTAASPTPDTEAPAGVPVAAMTREQRFSRPGYRPRSVPPPGHAERIWVYNHIMANLTVYSLTQEMNPTKAFRQFAFTGKKLVPAKLRKDYWRPLAVVEFGEGKGDVGRSVFQKLRELKKRHLLEWDADATTEAALLRMSRRERGEALNDQRGIFVADLAAVLAGRGKGNRMVIGSPTTAHQTEGVQAGGGQEVQEKEVSPTPAGSLHAATVYWANEQDKYYAREWSDNVTHVVGLPEKGIKKTAEPVTEDGEAAEAPKADE
ncbi:transcriptional regulation of mitochondrial recombination-domain-containing protein [Corynascus novoguineensis]|uniref:Large ribosomal subunit protein mL67 n=1 Tax=Corynascus novoguineensis TaxID=1126955 RepID=A0AAN7CXC0_9PEZI|nr:transcriptional regulation of mitochondrial recombination-domain-containing protein [Corynascus novoguineensis]